MDHARPLTADGVVMNWTIWEIVVDGGGTLALAWMLVEIGRVL